MEFIAKIYIEKNRSFIIIPFNIYQKIGLKGSIFALIKIDNIEFGVSFYLKEMVFIGYR